MLDAVRRADAVLQQASWPVYKSESPVLSYRNAAHPVYVVNGAAGNKEHLTGIGSPPYPGWNRQRLADYGYGADMRAARPC